MPRPHRIHIASVLLLCAGCSATSAARLGPKSEPRSLAVVGDRSLPATVGEPGDQVAADVAQPEPRRNPRTRISGRVLDERGRPVPDATVRLADGGTKGGRDTRTTTDRSGAFTLGGLRFDADYLIVAESETADSVLTGRARARTSDTGVIINLGQDDDAEPARRPDPDSPRARPISNREFVAEPGEDRSAARLNGDDLAATPANTDDPSTREPRGRRTAELSAPTVSPGSGWHRGGDTSQPAESDDPASGIETDDEDGPNPLPPAIEPPGPARPDRVSSRRADPADPAPSRTTGRSRPDPGSLALATPDPVEPTPRLSRGRTRGSGADPSGIPSMAHLDIDDREGSTTPPEVVTTAGDLEPDPDSLLAASPGEFRFNPTTATRKAASDDLIYAHTAAPITTTGAANQEGPTPASDNPPDRPYDPFALAGAAALVVIPTAEAAAVTASKATPGPSDLDADPTPSSRPSKKWGDLASRDPMPAVSRPTKASPGLLQRLRKPASSTSPVILCNFDARHRKMLDFQLPDLDGKPVRIRDLDADFILLDFWGTWCKPCLDSIPHLVDLQKKYGPSKLRVVGIACEQVARADAKARVADFARRSWGSTTRSCSRAWTAPARVQNALQVQFYPTMVLLDRTGKVLWRDRGATPATLDRLDRTLRPLARPWRAASR